MTSIIPNIFHSIDNLQFYTVTADNIDEIPQDSSGFKLGYGIINNDAIICFSVRWIAMQMKITASHVNMRSCYGANGWTEWEAVT